MDLTQNLFRKLDDVERFIYQAIQASKASPDGTMSVQVQLRYALEYLYDFKREMFPEHCKPVEKDFKKENEFSKL